MLRFAAVQPGQTRRPGGHAFVAAAAERNRLQPAVWIANERPGIQQRQHLTAQCETGAYMHAFPGARNESIGLRAQHSSAAQLGGQRSQAYDPTVTPPSNILALLRAPRGPR